MPDATKPSTYCLVVNCSAVVGSCVTATDVSPPKVRLEPPKETPVVPMVTDELVSDELGMFDRVLFAPSIDLLVNVCVPVSVATVESIAMVTAELPLNDVPLNPDPMVSAFVVLAVTVADPPRETELPLIVTLLLVRLPLPMFDSVLSDPLIVLLVRVCVPVSVATVESIEMVMAEEPL